jgi:hypothetical protein
MTVLITVVLPPGGDAGPFNLYSNTDGYVAPFATNISAAALQAGYTALFVPDGTTIIRVQSVGVCTNFVNVQVNVLPTTTSTTSTSTSSTSTTTSTSTTAAPTSTTTSSSTSISTSTSTSSTTTTTTTCPCYIWNVSPTAPDVEAGLDVTYIKCNGALTVEQDVKIAGIDICVTTGEGTPILSRDVPGEITSTVTQTSECCSPTPIVCYVYQVNGDPTPAATPETPRAEHIVQYVDCVTNTIETVIAYGAGYLGFPEPTIQNICAIQILADNDEPLTDGPLSVCTPSFTTTTTTTTPSPNNLIANNFYSSVYIDSVFTLSCSIGLPADIGPGTIIPGDIPPCNDDINVVISGASISGHCMSLIINGVIEDEQSFTTDGTYVLTNPGISSTDIVVILVRDGNCLSTRQGIVSTTSSPSDACTIPLTIPPSIICWVTGNTDIVNGLIVYTDMSMLPAYKFVGDGDLYHIQLDAYSNSYSMQINNIGVIDASLGFICGP